MLEGTVQPGRYNRAGERTLYVSASREGIAAAMARYGDRPRALMALQVEAMGLLDLRDPAACMAMGLDAAAAAVDWQASLASGTPTPSWMVADRARGLGATGLIDPSRRAPGRWHLVLFGWNDGTGAQVWVDEPFDRATLAFYADEAFRYAARKLAPSIALAPFLALLPAGARVLELGCGGGQDAAAMIAAGFDVDATDGCAAMTAEAERRLHRPVRVMRFDELTAVDSYDAVWAAASLLHVPRAGLADVLARVWRALVPGGVFAASFKTGGVEGRDGFGRLYNRPTLTGLREAYAAAGAWEEIAVEERDGAGYDGVRSDWVGLVVRKV